jgi:hypothetical protein
MRIQPSAGTLKLLKHSKAVSKSVLCWTRLAAEFTTLSVAQLALALNVDTSSGEATPGESGPLISPCCPKSGLQVSCIVLLTHREPVLLIPLGN